MLVLSFFSWWYGAGWKQLAHGIQNSFIKVSQAFSATSLLRTLFAPWRRIVSYPGAGLSEHMRATLDNLVSRCVGFVVRILVLLSAGIIISIVAVFGFIGLLLWPFVPLVPLAGLIGGLIL
jgi:hypothetical protein